ncbi:hypothetical protein AAFL37_01420 [Staphylococcus lugdunensis]|uniref:hypothetical protein n=1 Tax=Staphylococcus TaxID=1279 RepID=UPI0008A349D9|nr:MULTISPECIES: hypothetical protein [Staphylococcus]ARJ14535.1 hypothetical protein B7468_09440 [Staphylococcus lugdunensis]MCH8665924.1 hypothetical protein [Staphylococcus lugdunensis]OFJ65389.1 hypothetical protein HMPREF2855_04400 [Staphylococcus sp. HMSC077E11]OFM43475.1 hypothetical protein HMPREF2688_04770 [Staphylococcus sp. HMSC077E12]OFR90544.1 hypothetical protein HMPREF2864_06025 [Staphylococcus sp. HMSC059F04]
MPAWDIHIQSKHNIAVQEFEQSLSVIEPIDDSSFQILAEIDLKGETPTTYLFDDTLVIDIQSETTEIKIFDK